MIFSREECVITNEDPHSRSLWLQHFSDRVHQMHENSLAAHDYYCVCVCVCVGGGGGGGGCV